MALTLIPLGALASTGGGGPGTVTPDTITGLAAFITTFLKASNTAAARAAIGAGTSDFDGVYSNLSGKPTLSTVAGTGAYGDLSGKPTIPTAASQVGAVPGSGTNLGRFRGFLTAAPTDKVTGDWWWILPS